MTAVVNPNSRFSEIIRAEKQFGVIEWVGAGTYYIRGAFWDIYGNSVPARALPEADDMTLASYFASVEDALARGYTVKVRKAE